MKRNWYAIYTKSHCEKKVSALLSKKEIKNYYPVNHIINFQDERKKTTYEPLFSTIVFVYINEEEMSLVKKTNCVISFVYWLGKPAVIKNDEIVSMQYFTTEYSNLKLEKTTVNPDEFGRDTSDPQFDVNGKLFSVKNTQIKLLLPSLGYIVVAESESVPVNIFNYNFDLSKPVTTQLLGEEKLTRL